MTAAQPNNLGYLAGTVGDDVADVTTKDAEPPPPKYTGDMPDDPEEARSYRPGEDRGEEPGSDPDSDDDPGRGGD